MLLNSTNKNTILYSGGCRNSYFGTKKTFANTLLYIPLDFFYGFSLSCILISQSRKPSLNLGKFFFLLIFGVKGGCRGYTGAHRVRLSNVLLPSRLSHAEITGTGNPVLLDLNERLSKDFVNNRV